MEVFEQMFITLKIPSTAYLLSSTSYTMGRSYVHPNNWILATIFRLEIQCPKMTLRRTCRSRATSMRQYPASFTSSGIAPKTLSLVHIQHGLDVLKRQPTLSLQDVSLKKELESLFALACGVSKATESDGDMPWDRAARLEPGLVVTGRASCVRPSV